MHNISASQRHDAVRTVAAGEAIMTFVLPDCQLLHRAWFGGNHGRMG